MLTAVPYIWVPILSVLFYSFLLIAFCSSKKNKLIYSFMRYVLVLLLWTGGSLLMRMQFAPGYTIWYQVSIVAVFALPFTFYDFIYCYLKANNKVEHIAMQLMTAVMLVLTFLQAFLAIPEIHTSAGGRSTFVYHADWRLIFPTVMAVILVGLSIKMTREAIKVRHEMVADVYLPVIGAAILIIGNIISVIPGNIFPFDTFAGLINGGIVFYTLTRRRVFKLTLLVSPHVILYCTLVMAILLSTSFVDDFLYLIKRYVSSESSAVIILSGFFTVVVLIITLLAYKGISRISLRREQVVQDSVKNFSLAVSKSLEVNEILDRISDVLCEGIGTSHVMIFMHDSAKKEYVLSHTVNPLDNKKIGIKEDAPYVEYLRDNGNCLMISEFKKSVMFRSMWDSEKKLMRDCDIACIASVSNKEKITGILLIGSKNNRSDYNYDDLVFIESIQSIASIALNNALLFEETRKRADMDVLTGMLNRNAFLRETEKAVEECRGNQISLIMISLDDFRLYNELYGTQEGDKALQYISRIIINSVAGSDISGRYGGKEFSICLPGKNQMQALQTAENIRLQLSCMDTENNGIKMKRITFCAGICSIPYGATNLKELLTNANMQVYSGKHSGKDKIITYQSDQLSGEYSCNDKGMKTVEDMLNAGGYEEAMPTIYALTAAIDAKDHYTFKHSSNVANYASLLAQKAGLSTEHVRLINEAGLLHDVGKIAIPEGILSKPGKLEPEEYEIMKSHVEHSIEIIRHLPDLDYLIPTVVGHHERWDGKGYPNGLEGSDIPMGARCLAIADSFDAMTSKRSYKEAFAIEFAAKEISEQAGKQFDPELARLFVELIKSGQIKLNQIEVAG